MLEDSFSRGGVRGVMSHLGGKSDNRINNFTNSQINLKSIINRLMFALGVGLLPIVQQTHQIFQSCVFKLNHCERQLLHLYTNCEDQVLQTRLRILVIKPPVSKTSRNKLSYMLFWRFRPQQLFQARGLH